MTRPTATLRATATKAALLDALADLFDSRQFDPDQWSEYDAETLERGARRIREGIAERAAERAAEQSRNTNR
jgi:hypothetical protein